MQERTKSTESFVPARPAPSCSPWSETQTEPKVNTSGAARGGEGAADTKTAHEVLVLQFSESPRDEEPEGGGGGGERMSQDYTRLLMHAMDGERVQDLKIERESSYRGSIAIENGLQHRDGVR